jgi:dTDP-L-rhamnose 4-epimerase
MNENILVTGGAGFIGSQLILELLKHGYQITVLDNLSPQIHGEHRDSASYNAIKDKVNFILGDVRNKSDWKKALKNQHIVIHLAAETGTGQSMYQIHKYVNSNVLGISVLLDILANSDHSVRKILLASSRAVYGEGKYLCSEHGPVYPSIRKKEDLLKHDFQCKCPFCLKDVTEVPTDEKSLTNPVSVYGITKLVQEQLLLSISKSINIPSVIFRFQNVYGPFQSLSNPYTGILSIFSNLLLNNQNVYVFEDGKESRDFIFIDDVVRALVMSLSINSGDYEIFNIGSGIKTSVFEIATALMNNYKSNSQIIINNQFRIGDIRHNFADKTKIDKYYSFAPEIDLKRGLERFCDWVLTQNISKIKFRESLNELEKRGLLK